MKFHHIGIACKDLNEFKEYMWNMFQAKPTSEIVFDPNQNGSLQLFTTIDGTVFEGISGEVVTGLLKKRNYLYHTCFETEDMEASIKTLEATGSMLISEPKPAPLFNNRKVCFLTSDIGLVELLEANHV